MRWRVPLVTVASSMAVASTALPGLVRITSGMMKTAIQNGITCKSVTSSRHSLHAMCMEAVLLFEFLIQRLNTPGRHDLIVEGLMMGGFKHPSYLLYFPMRLTVTFLLPWIYTPGWVGRRPIWIILQHLVIVAHGMFAVLMCFGQQPLALRHKNRLRQCPNRFSLICGERGNLYRFYTWRNTLIISTLFFKNAILPILVKRTAYLAIQREETDCLKVRHWTANLHRGTCSPPH